MADRLTIAYQREARIRKAERRVERAVVRALTALTDMALVALDESGMDDSVLDVRWPDWAAVVAEVIEPEVAAVYEQAYGDPLLAAGPVETPAQIAARLYLDGRRNHLVNVGDHVFDLIRATLQEGRAAGEDIRALGKRVDQVLADEGVATWRMRGQTVARTEVIGAHNAGHHAAVADMVDSLGIDPGVVVKEWIAAHDDRTRPTHLEADGMQALGLASHFPIGNSDLAYPGDPNGTPEEVINCRCTLLYLLPGDADYPDDIPPPDRVLPPLEASAGPTQQETAMPWSVVNDNPDCDGFAVVNDDTGEVMGCHDNEADAQAQLTALNINVKDVQQSAALDTETDRQWYGVLAPEGVLSGDRRKFAPGALTWRDLPLPMEWQEKTAPYHDGAVVVGRIDSITRDESGLLHATGTWHDSEDALKAYDLVENRMLRGFSVELDEATVHLEDPDTGTAIDGDEWFWEAMAGETDVEPIEVVDTGRICTVTLLPVPAFQEAFVANGTETAGEEALVASMVFVSEKPWGNFTAADYTPAQWKDATLIHLDPAEGQDPESKNLHKLPVYEPGGALNRGGCHAAAAALAGARGGVDAPADKKASAARTLVGLYRNQLDEEPPDSLTSLAGSLGRSVTLTASSWPVVKAEHFTNPDLAGPTAITVDKDGRVYGHLARWGTCHVGFDGTCVTPPHSETSYAYFLTGLVMTDEGAAVPVGSITMDTGHAEPTLAAAPAVAHYDDTGSVVADVTCGEDEHGIWLSGSIRPGVSREQVARFVAAGAVSGDWRRVGRGLELVAALVVNTPGFPMPRLELAASAGVQTSLLASGVVGPQAMAWRTGNLDVDALVAAVVARIERRSRIAKAAAQVRGYRVADVIDLVERGR